MVELARGSDCEKTGEIVEEHLATGGKRLRARLALAAAQALGASVESAVPWAAACELLHNATLVHDDLQDGDELRRGHPTTWVRHGMPSAINAGDLLLVLPTLAIEKVPASDSVRWHLSRALAFDATRVIRGQVAEFEMTRLKNPTLAGYNAAIEGKTSPLFELPVVGAAMIAGRSVEESRALGLPFNTLGTLFQIQDDTLDLYGEKGRDAPGADIREGKPSALVVTHLEHFPAEREEILAILDLPREQTPASAVSELIARFRDAGTLDRVLKRMKREAAEASEQMAMMGEPELGQLLDELIGRVVVPIGHLMVPG